MINRLRQGLAVLILLLFPYLQLSHAQDACPVQSQPNVLFRFVAYGDTRTNNDIHQDIVNKVVKYQPRLILQTGDLVENAGDLEQWKTFDRITAVLHPTAPDASHPRIAYYPARGNHDNNSNGEYEKRVAEPFQSGTKLYYRFDVGDIRFIALDTETLNPKNKKSQAFKDQFNWLQSELQQGMNDHKFMIPFFHVAVYSIGSHGSDKELRKVLEPLFKQYGVKLVFQGHDHNYYRTQRDNITYVVSGGGGAPLYPFKHQKEAIAGDIMKQEHHFCVCDVYPDKVIVTVFSNTSCVPLDTFTIQRSAT